MKTIERMKNDKKANYGSIDNILTCMKDGDEDYLSMLPCYYKAPEKQVEECA